MLATAGRLLRRTPVVALLRRRALRRGLWEGHGGWRLVAFIWFGLGLLRRLMGPRVEHLSTERLRAGQAVTVRARRGRRRR